MKRKLQIAYIPIGVPTFHLESAEKEFKKSKKLISKITDSAVFPSKMLLTMDDLGEYLDGIDPNFIIVQNITFANAAYISEILKRFKCPILLWTLREPVIDGGRLRLNSLTGAYSAGNALMTFRGGNFEYVFGSPEEAKVERKIRAIIKAAELVHSLKGLKIAAVGHTPQGFGFGRALDAELLHSFGVSLDSIEARELMEKAKTYSDDEWKPCLKELEDTSEGLDNTPEVNKEGFARLYKAYKDYVESNNVGALASRCWPDFFTSYGTPVCSVLGMLNDLGVAASCESDTYGALSMYMGMKLSGQAVFFGDPVSMDEEEGSITFWHCGMAPNSLAREDTGATIGVHPNRKIGPVMDFGCKPCDRVTIFRVGREADGSFRFLLMGGQALDKPKQFCGTSVVVKTDNPVEEVVYDTVTAGWEPHYVVVYGDIAEEIKALGRMLGIKVWNY